MLMQKTAAPSTTLAGARVLSRVSRGLIYAIVAVGSVMSMFPFVWAVLSSGKDTADLLTFPPTLFPAHPQFVENYTLIWTLAPFGRWILNSVHITILALIGTVLSASIVAYSFSRFSYPGRDVIFIITLATMMLPAEVTLIPSYQLFKLIGWVDTFNPLIVPLWLGGGAFNIFLMRQFFMSIPPDLDEAAEIDGANSWQIFWRILMPLSKPALATMATLGFIGHWNNFLGPLIYLNSQEKFTAVLGLRYFMQGATSTQLSAGPPKEHLLMAASIVVALPCLILFFLAQRYFVQGIVTTGIKG